MIQKSLGVLVVAAGFIFIYYRLLVSSEICSTARECFIWSIKYPVESLLTVAVSFVLEIAIAFVILFVHGVLDSE